MRILFVGCGYTVMSLACRLRARGEAVVALVRTEESARALAARGLTARAADCRDPAAARRACAGDFDAVVFSLAANGADPREIYGDAFRHVLDALARHPPRFFAYTGSTSVYGRSADGWVTEELDPSPATPNARILLEAERQLAERAKGRFAAVVLRLGGLYGPGRSHLLDRLRDGAETLSGSADAWMNRIHRDDAASALEHLLFHPFPAIACEMFNVTDNAPARRGEVVGWICARLGRALPRFEAAAAPSRHGADANRRVSNARLRALGWSPEFPTYREGFGALLDQREG